MLKHDEKFANSLTFPPRGLPYTEGLGHYFECWSILQEKPTEIAVRELSNILGLLQSQGAKGSLAYGSVVLGDA